MAEGIAGLAFAVYLVIIAVPLWLSYIDLTLAKARFHANQEAGGAWLSVCVLRGGA